MHSRESLFALMLTHFAPLNDYSAGSAGLSSLMTVHRRIWTDFLQPQYVTFFAVYSRALEF